MPVLTSPLRPAPSRRHRPGLRFALAIALLALAPAGLLLGPALTSPEVSATTTGRPDVVLVVTDDQRLDTLDGMTAVQDLLVRQGTWFRQGMVPTALCCPSRATILTGRYAHSTGVWGNGDVGGSEIGGWSRFHSTRNEERTIATALAAQGYRTGLFGKYLNYFGDHAPTGWTPPGWDVFTAIEATHGAYYDYRLTDGTRHGTAPEDYSTDVLRDRAVEFIEQSEPGRPLFVYFAPFGPHKPYTPASRHVGAWEGRLPPFEPPAAVYDIRDNPAWLTGREHVTDAQVDDIRQAQHEALMAVDGAVATLVETLRETGRLANTLFVFTSDNGYLWNEHRQVGKDVPYAAAVRVPLVVRWDGHVAAGAVDDRLALNLDLAQTVSDAAGTPMTTDGHSLLSSDRRDGFVLEAAPGYGGRPAYCGWRTTRWMYVRYATGERELYDYAADPWETVNRIDDAAYADVVAQLDREARAACVPAPPGFDWGTVTR